MRSDRNGFQRVDDGGQTAEVFEFGIGNAECGNFGDREQTSEGFKAKDSE